MRPGKMVWHSVDPRWTTGYGGQTAVWVDYLASQGWDIAISSYAGSFGRIDIWQSPSGHDIPIFPAPPGDTSQHELLAWHAHQWEPDLTVILGDIWKFNPSQPPAGPHVLWVPVDSATMDPKDLAACRYPGAIPLAMSQHGLAAMVAEGLPAHYIPHAVNTDQLRPLDDRLQMRKDIFGIDEDRFVVGILASTVDGLRKGYSEQIHAFAKFKARHPEAMLWCHAMSSWPGGNDLRMVAKVAGAGDIYLPDPHAYVTGQFGPDYMTAWYNACDIVSNVSWGEGFGLAGLEAQACGTPVVLARNSTGPELVGPGWLAECQPWASITREAAWGVPLIPSIVDAYEKAWRTARSDRMRERARAFAEGYSVEQVGPMWDKLLAELETGDA